MGTWNSRRRIISFVTHDEQKSLRCMRSYGCVIEEVSAKTLGPIAPGEAAGAVPGRRRAKGGREVSPKPSQTHASGALAYRAAAE
jgi:hypothetical protein